MKSKIPAPKVSNWKKIYGSWEGFCKAIHKSIGRILGKGKVKCKKEDEHYRQYRKK